MEDVQRALHRLRGLSDAELGELCRPHAVRVLTIFGSAIDPEVVQPRDLDLGVVFEPGAPHDVLGLLETLVARLGSERIDLLDATVASETARMRAIADGVGIFESEPGGYAAAAAAAEALYLETAPLRRAALEALAP